MIRTQPPATTPSFEKSAKPLLLALKPSRYWQFFLYALHALCVIAVAIAVIPAWIKLLLTLIIASSLYYHHRRLTDQPQLVWRTGNRWFINDEKTPVKLSSIDFFSRWLVVLSLSREKISGESLVHRLSRNRRYVIPCDSLDKDTFRLLRVRLRIEGYELLNPTEDPIK